jgi:undecaprenyl-diphosphatase
MVVWWSVLALTGLVIAELTDNVVDHDGLTRLDAPWHRWVVAHRSPGLTWLTTGISALGSTMVLAAVALCVAAWLAWRRHWSQAVLVGMVTGGAGLLVVLVKNIVDRPRPPVADRLVVETNWSYPSGHSLGATAVIGVLTIIALTWVSGRVARAAVVTLGVLLVVAIGVSRFYLGVHWPSDILAGWLIGGLWLAVCHTLITHRPKRHPHSVRFDQPVIDERTDQELRIRYYQGQISIGAYLDRRFGTAFNSAGDRRPAG